MGSKADLERMHSVSIALIEAGYKTYSPVDDGYSLLLMFDALERSGADAAEVAKIKYWMMAAVYAYDIFNQLKNCNVTVCNLQPYLECAVNPDSGTDGIIPWWWDWQTTSI